VQQISLALNLSQIRGHRKALAVELPQELDQLGLVALAWGLVVYQTCQRC
jgi:hypothetical protein